MRFLGAPGRDEFGTPCDPCAAAAMHGTYRSRSHVAPYPTMLAGRRRSKSSNSGDFPVLLCAGVQAGRARGGLRTGERRREHSLRRSCCATFFYSSWSPSRSKLRTPGRQWWHCPEKPKLAIASASLEASAARRRQGECRLESPVCIGVFPTYRDLRQYSAHKQRINWLPNRRKGEIHELRSACGCGRPRPRPLSYW